MSAAPIRLPEARGPEKSRPALAVVPRKAAAKPRLAYALIAVTGIVLITVCQLLLSVAISQGAYDIDALAAEKSELLRTTQSVSEDLDRVASPQYLAANAAALGMVPNANPVYVRLSDGAVLGVPTPAAGEPVAAADLVPNALLAGVPLATEQTPAGGTGASAPAPKPSSGTPVAVPVVPAESKVALRDGLPTPVTH